MPKTCHAKRLTATQLYSPAADRPFDKLAAVLVDGKFRVMRGAIIPYEVVQPRAAYVDSIKGWKFMLRDSVWELPGVIDATAELRATELLI